MGLHVHVHVCVPQPSCTSDIFLHRENLLCVECRGISMNWNYLFCFSCTQGSAHLQHCEAGVWSYSPEGNLYGNHYSLCVSQPRWVRSGQFCDFCHTQCSMYSHSHCTVNLALVELVKYSSISKAYTKPLSFVFLSFFDPHELKFV